MYRSGIVAVISSLLPPRLCGGFLLIRRAVSKVIRHGGKHKKIDLSDVFSAIEDPKDDILAINDALDKLANEDPKLAEVIKLRYFGGLALNRIAAIMGIGRRTVDIYWALGRAWLYQEITQIEK